VTDRGWKCTDCKYEGAPRETRTCPRCCGKMDTAQEREVVANKARLADSVEEVCHCGAFFSTVNTVTGQPHCDGPKHHPLPTTTPKPDRRARLVELLGSRMRDAVRRRTAEQVEASWVLQSPEEKKRRRRAIIELAIELGRIREVTQFSTLLAETAIEAVIEGDWKRVEEWAEHFTFVGESDELCDEYAPIFAVFTEMLRQAVRARKELPV
jgi:hypothetical protein